MTGLVVEAAAIGVAAGGVGTLIGILVAAARSTRDGGGLTVPWPLLPGSGSRYSQRIRGPLLRCSLEFKRRKTAEVGPDQVTTLMGALLPAWAATKVPPIMAIRDL